MKTLTADIALNIVGKLLRDEVDRAEVASWARAYSELLDDHSVKLEPDDKAEVLVDVVRELSTADLFVNETPVLDQGVLRHLYVRLSQGLMVQ